MDTISTSLNIEAIGWLKMHTLRRSEVRLGHFWHNQLELEVWSWNTPFCACGDLVQASWTFKG